MHNIRDGDSSGLVRSLCHVALPSRELDLHLPVPQRDPFQSLYAGVVRSWNGYDWL